MKQPRLLPVEAITFAASVLRAREMPKTIYRSIWCKLLINHTNGASPAITIDSFLNVLSRVSLVINGQDVLIAATARHWYYENQYDVARTPTSSLFTTASSTGNSYIWFMIPLAMTRALEPEDGLLDARNFKSLVLEANFGSAIGTGVTTLNSGTLYLYPDEYATENDEIKSARHEFNSVSRNLDATGERTIELEVGSNNQYRRLWIYTRDSAGVLSNAQIDNLIVQSRSFHYINAPADLLQQHNAFDYSRDPQTGLYVVDFIRDGKLTQRADARMMGELTLKVNSLVSNGSIECVKEKAIFA